MPLSMKRGFFLLWSFRQAKSTYGSPSITAKKKKNPSIQMVLKNGVQEPRTIGRIHKKKV